MTRAADMDSCPSDEGRLFEEASEWFLRVNRTDGAADIRGQLEAWCAQGSVYESAYRKVEAAWEAIGANAAAPELVAARRDALEHAHQAARRGWNAAADDRSRVGWAVGLLAAAACLVLVVWATGVWKAQVRIYETAAGETRALTLPDNSRVTLDAESRIAVAYPRGNRRVELLQGQAYFDVAKDPAHPFEVKVANTTVVARGTAFNVEHREDLIAVTLLEGRVTVTQGEHVPAGVQAPTRELVPGEQLIIKGTGQVEPLRKVSLERVTAWRRGKIILQGEALSEACVRMNRYSRIKLVVEDKAIASLGVSGVFDAGDTAAFAEAVESLLALKAVRTGDDSILLVRAN